MIMTQEEQIEEILMESHSFGLRIEVMDAAKEIMGSNPSMRKVEAYEEAFKKVTEQHTD